MLANNCLKAIKGRYMCKFSKYLSKDSGFTLIEVSIVVVIIGILTSITYPSYIEHITLAKRTEGQRALLRIANLQEQYFSDHYKYTENIEKLGLGSNEAYLTEGGYYLILSKVSKTGFRLTAKAKGEQALNDLVCLEIFLDETGKRLPKTCWQG
jgi:type IV pilus assembly protein PilE